jgi:hypothetical protein
MPIRWGSWTLLLVGVALAQSANPFQRFQDPGNRVAFFTDWGRGQHFRLLTKAAIGETALAFSSSQGPLTGAGLACQTWVYQGVLSGSFVFEVTDYTAATNTSSSRAYVTQAAQSLRSQDRGGYTRAVTQICAFGELGLGPVRVRTIYVPVQPITYVTPPALLGRPFALKLLLNPEDSSLEVDLEARQGY